MTVGNKLNIFLLKGNKLPIRISNIELELSEDLTIAPLLSFLLGRDKQ